MKETLMVAMGVFLGGLILISAVRMYDTHCKTVPFLGTTFCAATFGGR